MKIMFAREWRLPKIMTALLIVELPLTIACLLLTGIAQDDTYKTKLWQNGADHGFNSSPSEILYAAANYKPMPTPTVWSNAVTEYNVIISVLSMFVQLVKSVMYVMHCFLPLLSIFVHAILLALYLVSVFDQAAPDLSDPTHPSPGLPWYLSKGCGFASKGNYSYCMQARSTFVIVVLLSALFAIHLVYSIWCVFPTAEEKAERYAELRDTQQIDKLSMYVSEADLSDEDPRESNSQRFLNLPPMTPRTTALSRLNGSGAETRDAPSYAASKSKAIREFFKPKPIRLG